MKPVDNQILLNQLKWRYATKKFDPTRKISPGDWHTLEEALISTASSFGLQPWHFVVITSQEMKEKLKAVSYGQAQLVDASHVVVFAARKGVDAAYVQKYIDRIAEVRGVPADKLDGFKNVMLGAISSRDTAAINAWSAKQAYIALGNLLTCAAMLGIDACPMEGIDQVKYDEILELNNKGLSTVMIAALGYRAADCAGAKMPKVRFKAEEMVTHIA